LKRLLIDIGNTRFKKALGISGSISDIYFKSYRKDSFEAEFRIFLNPVIKDISNVYISSLNKKNNLIIKRILKEIYPGIKVDFISSDSKLPLKFNYQNTLGADRICTSTGAFSKYLKNKNILLIDSGTATTFNLIRDGVFEGGTISAGLKLCFESLLEKTTLPKVKLNRNIKLINKNTNDAILSGVYLQQIYFIRAATNEYKKLYKNLKIIATGGGFEIIKDKFKNEVIFDKNLVLYGLNQIAIFNETIQK